ncbi:NAD(P)-binding protein [Exidia glandulosa HHB12029]|uniref:NAD(P)-binding protein n=1 Tax=Exidia glandulosa HHB12029 TaxID=1314781 RepID=A0A166N0X5_EXIGL|nr:NAD(P)-binding protein [Exidia glandulosa HHB12029]
MPTWLITGCSRGIGLELTRQLAANGVNTVFATCRNPASATALSELAKSHGNVHIVLLDVDDDATVQAAAETVSRLLSALGLQGNGIDYLSLADELDSVKADTMIAMFNTHVVGAYRLYHAFMHLIRLSERKAVINVSSPLGSLLVGALDNPALEFGAHFPSYCCAKAGLNMLTRKIAKGHPDFIIFAFGPGWVKTDMGGPDAPHDVEWAVERHINTVGKVSRSFPPPIALVPVA